VIKNCSPDLCNIIVLLQVHQKEIKAERGSPIPPEAMDGEKSHVALSGMVLRH
jgi:hypothetical protein